MSRVVFVSLEFLGPVFSGNGQYARSLVRALKSAGVRVLVVSGRREDVPLESQDDEGRRAAESPNGVIDIPLPAALWNRLDRHSAWKEFAAGCAQARVRDAIAAFSPSMTFAVDWHGMQAWLASCSGGSAGAESAELQALPVCFLNFRVYCTSSSLFGGDPAHPDAAFYRAAERVCLRAPQVRSVVALCRSDAVSLAALAAGVDPLSRAEVDAASGTLLLVPRESSSSAEPAQVEPLAGLIGLHSSATPEEELSAGAPGSISAPMVASRKHAYAAPQLFILLPPLRRDVAAAAADRHATAVGFSSDASAAPTTAAATTPRPLFTCCVRLSPEKGPLRFARVAAALADLQRAAREPSASVARMCDADAADQLEAEAHHEPPLLVPVLFGAVGDAGYAADVRSTLATVDGSSAARLSPALAAAIPLEVAAALPEAAAFVKAHAEAATGTSADVPTALASAGAAPRSLQLTRFVEPEDLRVIMTHTALNAHPPDSDAYGMTIVEAAAFGAPTLLQQHARPPIAGEAPSSSLRLLAEPVVIAPPSSASLAAEGGCCSAGRALPGFQRVAIECVGPVHCASASATAAAPGAGVPLADSALPSRGTAEALSLTPAAAAALIAASHFPGVGACDLLGEPLPIEALRTEPSGDTLVGGGAGSNVLAAAGSIADSEAAACVGVDWTSCDVSGGADRLARTLAQVIGNPVAADRLRAIAARAQAIALSWSESDSAAALVALVRATTGADSDSEPASTDGVR